MALYLGISAQDCNTTATFVDNGEIVYAAHEERFTRTKNQAGFPYHAVRDGLRYLNRDISDIERVGYGFFTPQQERRLYVKSSMTSLREFVTYKPGFWESLRHTLNVQRRAWYGDYNIFKTSERQLLKGLADCNYTKGIARFHHQLCHAASAYYTSGFDAALVLSLDCWGSGASGSVFAASPAGLVPIRYFPLPHSLGLMYSRVTKELGFVPNRHEGKIVALAAFGNPDKYYDVVFRDFILSKDGGYRYLNGVDPFKYRKIFKKGSPEDIAAAFQKVLETVVTHIVKTHIRKSGIKNICLAGGVTANVKMNQRIMELEECEALFVHPAMSDAGIGTGAALLLAHGDGAPLPRRLHDVFYGPDYSESHIHALLKTAGYSFTRPTNMASKIAHLLAENHIVARFNGRMEYGPRALGNRSILCSTRDKENNNRLNSLLKRTEFMPFAPATLDSAARDMYKKVDKIEYAAQFMTVATDCTDKMNRLSPAAIHVDGTARPQIVTRAGNPDLHSILAHYSKLTGVPSILNTSFNIHEEPIVCSPDDALKAFTKARLDYLALGEYLVELPHIAHNA